MYAIVEINGQQFKAEAGKKLFVHHIQNAENGATVEFDKVLLVAKDEKGIYVRVDNSNSAQKAISQEISKMAKSDVESKIYTDFNEQFQAIAWIILLLLLAEMLILDRKNPLFKNVHLFSNKK